MFEFQPDPGLQTIEFERPDLEEVLRDMGEEFQRKNECKKANIKFLFLKKSLSMGGGAGLFHSAGV